MSTGVDSSMLMPFGKYKGTPIDRVGVSSDGEVDYGYLRWAIEEVDMDRWPGLYEAIREFLARNGELNG